jgi:flotillin
VALREAEVQTLTAAAQARAAQSGPLAQAEAQQEVTRRQTELADLEAARKEKELLASTVRPAEADAEAVVRRAEGDREAKIAAAQAEAQRAKLAGQAEADVTVAKGEAQARVVRVNAEAEALRVTAEGNAEAEVTLTKGQAEAKALGLRAEAFKLFNDAAIIQTVLSQLPEIVRAAAEPMGNIDTLTILSSDGASEMVKNTTRTVAEASAAVKGLTGLDVPSLIGSAMGQRAASTPAAEPAAPRPAPGRAASRASSASSTTPARAGRGARRGDAAQLPPAAAVADAVEEIRQATAISAPGAGAAAAIPGARREPAEPELEIPPEADATEAARLLAGALARVPGIGRYREATLDDLASRGPRLARGLWARFGDRVAGEHRGLTVGELLDRFGA